MRSPGSKSSNFFTSGFFITVTTWTYIIRISARSLQLILGWFLTTIDHIQIWKSLRLADSIFSDLWHRNLETRSPRLQVVPFCLPLAFYNFLLSPSARTRSLTRWSAKCGNPRQDTKGGGGKRESRRIEVAWVWNWRNREFDDSHINEAQNLQMALTASLILQYHREGQHSGLLCWSKRWS